MIDVQLIFMLIIEVGCSNFNIKGNAGHTYSTRDPTSLSEGFNNQAREEIMKTTAFHSFRISSRNVPMKLNTSHGISFLDKGSSLSLQLRQIANTELGVTKLQDEFNSLMYIADDADEGETLSKMVLSLEEKVNLYSKLVETMSDVVTNSYISYSKNLESKKLSSSSLILNFGQEGQIIEEHQEYYPCCVIPDHYLIFNPHFGTRVNTELWCDSGIEQENPKSHGQVFFTPAKLTELFSMNHHLYPNIKWQFFMSANGVHTEFPAHRPGTSVGSDCGQSSRHHQIYEKTIRPNGRNIVLLYDLGRTLRARLLLTAKAIGHYIIDTLTEKDNIAALGISDSIVFPSPLCMASHLVPATHYVRSSLRHFVDYLEYQDVPTNHSLGFEKALQLIENWPASDYRNKGGTSTQILLVFITTGFLGDIQEVESVMKILAQKINPIRAQIVISAFGLGISSNEPSIQSLLLDTIVNQDYSKYGLRMKRPAAAGEVITVPSTLRVASIIKDFYNVLGKPKSPKCRNESDINSCIKISDIYWDEQGNGMVVTFSKAVFDNSEKLVGVVGVDISLAFLLESATYYNSPEGGYALVMDGKGNILDHPKMGRLRLLDSPLIITPATLLETSSSFLHLAPHMLSLSSGHKRSSKSSHEHRKQREYWWKTSPSFHWIFIISRDSRRRLGQKLSPANSPLPSHALFHRLDLLSPQEAKVCRHFNQMSTLDGAAIFLSASAYTSPNAYLATSFRNLNVDMNMMAYLMDDSNLIVNHGLNEKIKTEAGALYHISETWKEMSLTSKLQKYIVRRYGATLGGVTLMYPGTLLDATYDPTAQGWFIKAIERPGEVVVSPPFLDPGGAGYIVTVSHTVYQGLPAALHSPLDPVLTVLAADFTLGYWHKLLSDIEPLCANSIYFEEINVEERSKNNNVRCFLMDTSGYLIVHPTFVDPFSLRDMGHSHPRHITHQEPVLSMSLLGKFISPSNIDIHTPILKKIWCSKQWKGASERYYSVDLSVGKLASNHISANGPIKNERSCLQYKLAAVPASNLILGFLNQTCSPPTAFCPCSTIDRHCLNCQFMENTACECPCECALPFQPCSGHPYIPLTSIKSHQDISLANISGYENNSNSSFFNEEIKEWLGAPVACPRTPESPAPLHYGVGMLSQLSVCMPITCEAHGSIHSCFGVLDCVWCVLESDGQTLLDTPYCTQSHKCYGGIRGGPSPYPPGLAPLPHSEERASTLPIVPVIGGVLVIFLILGVAIYFYRTYTGVPINRNAYTPSSLQSQTPHSSLYPTDVCQDLESVENNLLDDRIMSAEAAAAMSPYRMNPMYRRPTNAQGEASDHGYSTMTPHEESDNLTFTDMVTSSFLSSATMNDHANGSSRCWSDNANSTEMFTHIPNNYNGSSVGGSYQTPLSSPKRIGPNRLIVPVTVHMVDTV